MFKTKIIIVSIMLFPFAGCSSVATVAEVEEIETENITIEEEVETESVVIEEVQIATTQAIQEDQLCSDDSCWDCDYSYSNRDGYIYEIPAEMPCNTAMRHKLSNSEKFLAYVDFLNIMIFNFETEETQQLMSVYDDTDGVSFQWSENDSKLAMVVVNQNNEDYELGTKVFVLELDEDGNMLSKDRYIVKVRYSCHDAGCNAGDEDFYFLSDDILKYRTWDTDPYEAEGDDSYLRELGI